MRTLKKSSIRRRTELTGRSIDMKKFRKVVRSRANDSREGAHIPTTMASRRRYGFFECPDCDNTWESSHVYCTKGTDEPLYEQQCKDCDEECMPYLVEKIRCAICNNEDCTCSWEEKEERHNDPTKPHRSDLCLKCQAGKPCT